MNNGRTNASTKGPRALTAISAAVLGLALLAASASTAASGTPESTPRSAASSAPQYRAQRAVDDFAQWEKKLILPPHVTARLDWARKSLAPSGHQKLERLALATAPAIAAGTDFAALRKKTEMDRVITSAGLSGMEASEAAFIVLAMATKDMDDDIRIIMAEIKATNAAKQKLGDQIKQLNQWISEDMSKAKDDAKPSDIDNTTVSGKPPQASEKPQAVKAPPARGIVLEKVASPTIHLEYVKAPDIPPLPPRSSGAGVDAPKSLLAERKSDLDGLNEFSEMTALRLQMTMDRRSKFISTLSQMMKKTSTTQDILIQNIK